MSNNSRQGQPPIATGDDSHIPEAATRGSAVPPTTAIWKSGDDHGDVSGIGDLDFPLLPAQGESVEELQAHEQEDEDDWEDVPFEPVSLDIGMSSYVHSKMPSCPEGPARPIGRGTHSSTPHTSHMSHFRHPHHTPSSAYYLNALEKQSTPRQGYSQVRRGPRSRHPSQADNHPPRAGHLRVRDFDRSGDNRTRQYGCRDAPGSSHGQRGLNIRQAFGPGREGSLQTSSRLAPPKLSFGLGSDELQTPIMSKEDFDEGISALAPGLKKGLWARAKNASDRDGSTS